MEKKELIECFQNKIIIKKILIFKKKLLEKTAEEEEEKLEIERKNTMINFIKHLWIQC